MKDMFKEFILLYGVVAFTLTLVLLASYLKLYIGKLMRNQTKIKWLCHHEYEPYSAFQCFSGIEYEFKCRKCGKTISIETVTDDKFNWVENKEDKDKYYNRII